VFNASRLLEYRVDAFHLERLRLARDRDQALAENRRRRAEDVPHLAQLLRLGVIVVDAVRIPDVDVRVGAEDAIAELLLEPGHQRQRDDQRHDADRDPEGRDHRDHRDERLLSFGEQVPEGDVQLEGEFHSNSYDLLSYASTGTG
jgi:hypothetical protein